LDEFRSTIEGRLTGDGETDGILEDRLASACSGDEVADLDTKWEKAAGWIGEIDRKAAPGGRANKLVRQISHHTKSNMSNCEIGLTAPSRFTQCAVPACLCQ
jgi:hypothetical protein